MYDVGGVSREKAALTGGMAPNGNDRPDSEVLGG